MKPGDVLDGRFDLAERAGAGGMGEVFQARDQASGVAVAVKVLHREHAANAERFLRESKLLARLSHPRIVRYIAQGMAPSGAPYLVMEWLDGEDLSTRLRRGRLSVDDALTLAAGTAEALAVVHGHGIVHRDIKPSNLFLVHGEVARVKLLDFGIAWVPDATRMTGSGAILGTPAYMAPEQARSGQSLDARADVFVLGCVLFECLTGRPAFVGTTFMDLLLKVVLEDVPSVRELSPDVPPEVDALCARMLAKDPHLRPRDGAAVAAAIRALGLEATLPLGDAQQPSDSSHASLTRDERRVRSIVLMGLPRRSIRPPRADAETVVTSAPEELRREVATRGAELDLLADGSVLITFAGTGLATDQAAQAAQCALSLRAYAGGRRIALATGRAELTERLPARDLIERALGALAQAAPAAQQIAIDEVTAGLLDARFDVEETHEGLWLRGEQVLAAAARTLLGKTTACVGRDWEINSLDALLHECIEERRARAVLLTGPAGMGKTRVGAELMHRIRHRGDPISFWIGRGDPLRAGAPLGLLSQALRGVMGIQDGEPPEVSVDKIRARVSKQGNGPDARRVAEFLGELLGAPFPDEGSVQLRAARGDARIMGDQMRRAWVDFLSAACVAQPVLLVLEDLHWGDLPTVQYIDEALRSLEQTPWMVLAMARPEVHDLFPGLWTGRDLQEIRLKSLSAKASARLVQQVLGDALDAEGVDRLVARANGNAFYLEELIRAAAAGKTGALPETVLAMVQSRLEGLDEPSRRLLRAASVFGAAFWRGAVLALVGGAGRMPIDEHLDRLLREEWIVARTESRFQGERELYFRHDLVREAAYGMLTEDDRALGHRLAGGWLERAAEPSAAVIAEHFDRGGEPQCAVEYYRRAAGQALAANDFGAVLARTERAQALGASGTTLGEVLLMRAEAYRRQADLSDAIQWAFNAMELLPKRSAPWYRAVTVAGHTCMDLNQHDRLIMLADQLTEGWIEEQASSAAVIAAAQMGVSLWLGGHHDRAEALHARIEAIAERFRDDPSVLGSVCLEGAIRANLHHYLGDAISLYESSVLYHERTGDWYEVCCNRSNLGSALCDLGMYGEAAAVLRAAAVEAERFGLDHILSITWTNLGLALGMLGVFEEAREVEGKAVAFFLARGAVRWEGMSRGYLARILLRSGFIEEAEAEARRAVKLLEPARVDKVVALATLASVLLPRRRPAEALAETSEAMAALEELGKVAEGEALTRVIHAEALWATGDREAARSAIADARDRLLALAARIEDPRWRDSFLRNVPENARTLELSRAWLGDEGA